MGNKINHYFNVRAGDYLKRSNSGIWNIFRKKERASIASSLNPQAGSSLIDLGCGAGYYAIFFKNQYKLNVFGVDSSSAMIYELKKTGIPCQEGSIETLNLHSVFDNALAAGVLEFVQQPDLFFKQTSRLLATGGKLVILIPNTHFFGWCYKISHSFFGCHTYLRTPKEYEAMANIIGFKKISEKKITPISTLLCFEKFSI